MENKVYAYRKSPESDWWAVIDCGPSQKGGMTTGNFWQSYFKKDGRTYRYFRRIFMPPEDLEEWQEISVREENVCFVTGYKNRTLSFEGWDDEEDGSYTSLQEFAKMIGKDMTIDEIRELINKNE